jgi:hypothetical protein
LAHPQGRLEVNKLIRKGCVAVIYSPEFGAGWSTWNRKYPEILFDPAIVEFVEKNQSEELEVYVTLRYPGIYDGGMVGLKIEWIPEGSFFRVNEHDGAESIEVKNELDWIVA